MDDISEIEPSSTAGVKQAAQAQKEVSAILVYTTFPSESEAKKAGRALVEARLAACVNIFPQMISIYSWEGKVEEGGEAAMIVKTATFCVGEVLDRIKALHPYSVPARLILPVEGGGEDFLKWIVDQCAPRGKM
jgi:periplasmic divalent cation tolerance protein